MTILQVKGIEMQVKAILFDKDGTLFEFMSLWRSWAQSLLDAVQPICSDVMPGLQLGQILGTSHDQTGRIIGYDLNGPLAMGSVAETETILAWLLYISGQPWSSALQTARSFRVKADQIQRDGAELALQPGLQPFLQLCALREVPLAVLTSDQTASAEEQLKAAGLRPYFQLVIGDDAVFRGKPDPEMIRLACRELGVHPSETVMIGDSLGDMRMAREAGIALSIGFAAGSEAASVLQEAADVQISSYSELSLL